MPLVPLEIPPGLFANGTDVQARGRWHRCSLVRWHEGAMRPVGGWERFGRAALSEKPRAAIGWKDNSGRRKMALGSASALTIINRERDAVDITPSDLVPGQETARQATGYGVGPYGRGAYGSSYTASTLPLVAEHWDLDTWGEYLIACSEADGRIFVWEGDEAASAAVIANAPTSNVGCVVTEERFLFALGAGGDPRKIQWCDRQNYDVWTPSATNQAGDWNIPTSGVIQSGHALRAETLILTDEDAWIGSYVGPNQVYDFRRVGQGCGSISRKSVALIDTGAVWMGDGGFYMYQGGAVTDLPCPVSDYLFGDLGPFTKSHINTVVLSEFSEIWWLYTSSAGTENDKYVSFNYETGVWATGELTRTCGIDRGVWTYPLMVGVDGFVYEHEKGAVPSGNAVYATTGPIIIGQGERTFTANHIYPDDLTQGDTTLTVYTRDYPNGTERTAGPYTMANPTSVRFTGRQMRVRVDGETGQDFRFGVPRVDVRARGRR